MSAKWNYFKPVYGTSAEGCKAVYLENIDTSLRRIAASLENGADVIERALAERDTSLVLGHPSIANKCDCILYGVDNNQTLASVKGLEELS